MKCPVCEKTLIVVERDKIELDWCHACGGFWFDADEWRLLGVEDDRFNPFAYPSIRVKGEKARKCPICGKVMEKIKIGDTILDRCPSLHGVWFDKGELSSLINYSNSDEKSVETVNFLGEVFNIKK